MTRLILGKRILKAPVRLGLLLVSIFTFSGSVQAHTALYESVPAADSVVKVPPEQLVLTFTGKVRLVKLEFKGVGHDMPTDFAPVAEAKEEFIIKTPGMHPGKFTATWTAMGADGHAVSNTFGFTVNPDATDEEVGHSGGGSGAGHDH